MIYFIYFYVLMMGLDLIFIHSKVEQALIYNIFRDEEFNSLMENRIIRFISELVVSFLWPVDFLRLIVNMIQVSKEEE